MTEVAVIGIDIGKMSFHLVALDATGAIQWKKKVSRAQLMRHMDALPRCLVGMEACCGAHHLARELTALDHNVRLMAPQFVKPFLKSNKNDYLDAEAVQRPTMRFVPAKSVEQLDLQALHRVRERLVSRRTAVINQIRAFLLERGIVFHAGRRHMAREMPALFTDERSTLSLRMRMILQQLWDEWRRLETDIGTVTKEIEAIAAADEGCRRLLAIPGVGPLVATALVAAVADGTGFKRGRDLAAWLGLVPRQHSTGGKSTLLGMSKRGNSHLRRLFIHGARSASMHMKREQGLGPWLDQLEMRTHKNVAVVALANKIVRISWAVLARQEQYRPPVPIAA
ncbi:MAG: IS110 family transposase [Sphingomonas adhaesiva]|uniref:IS110 family transposase n=1 Tax=Sphingomonas adhaesiva TaxID=28212 RepID=UPI002FF8119D